MAEDLNFDNFGQYRELLISVPGARKLDLTSTDMATGLDGNFNAICLLRGKNFLRTFVEEVEDLLEHGNDLRLPIVVHYIGEDEGSMAEFSADLGGPRKDAFTSYVKAVDEDQGLFVTSGGHYTIAPTAKKPFVHGVIAALCLIQNGPNIVGRLHPDMKHMHASNCMSEDSMQQFFKGLDVLGISTLMKQYPAWDVFHVNVNVASMSRRDVLKTFRPQFAPHGSNLRQAQEDCHQEWSEWLKEVGGGKRVAPFDASQRIRFEDVLRFVTGCNAEPPFGWNIPPTIVFVEVAHLKFPRADTCANQLSLFHPSPMATAWNKEKLYHAFDYSFTYTGFGNE